jgi:3'-phosphoadenosine 5'-phosphosulfate sulfotransferase (PAPS reductase)/FAD synthetase
MITFRDERRSQARSGADLVHTNPEGLRDKGITPFSHGSVHTHIMKTEALKQALDKYGFDAAFGGARRDEEKSRAKERISRSATLMAGTRRTSGPSCGPLQRHDPPRARASAPFRCRTGPSSTSGATS